MEIHLLALVRSHLNSGHFLYSCEFDVTRRLQAQYVARENDESKPMWEMVRIALPWNTSNFSSSTLRRMTGSSGISETGLQRTHVKLIAVSFRFLQSRLVDVSISDLNDDVSHGGILTWLVLTLYR